MSRTFGRFLVLFVFTTIACLGVAAIYSQHAGAAPNCAANGGTFCDNQDPQAFGCTPSQDAAALDDGFVDMHDHFSTVGCNTNWSFNVVHGDNDSAFFSTSIVRDAGPGLARKQIINDGISGCHSGCWGNMLYAPVEPTQACIFGTNNTSLGNRWHCTAENGFQ